jgi:putative ABC transport system ATP-binding protein
VLEDVAVRLGGRNVLEGIDLAAEQGSPLGLTGPSGSGKTSLCLVVAGVLTPSGGRILYDGRPFVSGRAVSVGLVLQNHGLVAGLTAEENVSLPMQARRMVKQQIARQCSEALAAVGLIENAKRPVDGLSGGERQRVGIARALALDPDVLVADEPTAELDPDNRERVLRLLRAHAQRRRIVVVASDDPEVVGTLPHLVELEEGRIRSDSRGARWRADRA